MASLFIDPVAAAELARGESREHLIERGHAVPANLKDISEIKPELLAVELGRLTKILDDEYRRIEETEVETEQTTEAETPKPVRARKRKPTGSKELAWADMGESVRRKPPAYWSD